MGKIRFAISVVLISLPVWGGAPAICSAQSGGSAAQSTVGQVPPPAANKGGGVLEIAPAPSPSAPGATESGAAQSATQNQDDRNSEDQGSDDDVALYRNYPSADQGSRRRAQLPYLGISVHATTVIEPNGGQQRALEVLSVDQGSPAAAAGIKGSGNPTKLGASGMTASALLGPAEFLMAPILKKTGQLGRQGDLIVAADDNRVGSEEELGDELARLKPGDTLWLTVLRESSASKAKAVRIPIKLGAPRNGAAPTSAAK
jgi:hypothetical protein